MIKLPSEKLDPKLIALDLDDTLLTKELKITPITVKALRDAAAKGIYIVPCSGRAENGILQFVRTLELAGTKEGRYVIALNGSEIFDLHTRTTIYSRKVPFDVLEFVYDEALKRGLPCQVYNSTTTFANIDNEFTHIDAKLCKLNMEIVPEFREFLKPGHTKMLVPGDEKVIAEFCAFLKRELDGRAVIFTSKPYFLEVMPPNCGKGEAIEWLANHLGIDNSKTMAFGDSMNDESMIRMTGYSVAMCNGLEYIQDIAKFVTRKSNEEDGIGDFINGFVL
ncbi:Cof-type HAD-IIB family hydrolase [Treponema sp.]|uniref:Cof-type HAD-IIB family hydrolase n=1 Tax=Treponema sp. TaxID=166 RepID=UPI00298E1D07|nr:Cof-type HAD-IIB family hydrolase [Treponema sp.]